MMKTTALSLIFGTIFFVGAAQAQPAKLTTSQMDQVTAGQVDVDIGRNVAIVDQYADSNANACGQAGTGCSTGTGDIYARAKSKAVNYSDIAQANVISFSFGD